jgi:uncharacterized membrane protein YbaN (DUF454 family)
MLNPTTLDNHTRSSTDTAPRGLAYSPLSTLRRWLLIAAGTVAVGLGILGIILPGMPATVFFLIAAACYTRSSDRLYRWLVSRPWAQKPLQQIEHYQRTGALPLRVKLIAMGAAWSSFALMALVPTQAPWFVKWIVLALAVACTAFMLTRKTSTD